MELCRYLKQGASVSLQPALRLGRKAVALGLDTLDLAGFHEKAIMKAVPPGGSIKSRQKMIKQANSFFSETLVPIERTHSAALITGGDITQLTQTLQQCTAESRASARFLKKSISRRQEAEAALKKSRELRATLLKDSNCLQKHLRKLMRTVLSENEDKHRKISKKLYNDIGQTLLAVNIRLLALKKVANNNIESLQKEIANTRRILIKSHKRFKRFTDDDEKISRQKK